MNTVDKNTLTLELTEFIMEGQDACQELYDTYTSNEYPTLTYECWLTRFLDECHAVLCASHEELIDENVKEE